MNGISKSADIKRDEHRYDDIMGLPHHVSETHPPMPARDRAAQFAPFAALTGHETAIRETARLTEERIWLTENVKAVLDAKLQIIKEQIGEHPEVTITYFQPDRQKSGGAYVQVVGLVKKIDDYEHMVVMLGGTQIPVVEIIQIEGELFRMMENGEG